MFKTMFCPLCCKEHDIEIIDREADALINGRHIKYTETVYICDKDEGNCFIPGGVMDNNLKAARKAYEKEFGNG